MKDFLSKYNISFTIIGTAIVLSTLFGDCSYDLSTKEVDVDPDISGIIEGAGKIIDDVKGEDD
jgi:hypothetical protein